MSTPAFKEINNMIESIPGEVCSGKQPEFLYRLSYGTKGSGEIVEIGTNVGKTAISLAYGQKVKKGKPIYSIDIYEHPDIKTNLEKAGVTDYVHRIIMPSHKMAKKWEKPIELLWIDGDHSYKGVCYDIKNWTRLVITGGVIAFHDYPGHKRSKEVWKALRKYLFKNPYTYRVISDREAGSIIAFQKINREPKKKSISLRFKKRLYWMYRNARSLGVRYFPGLAKGIKDAIKE
ncbi:MAG: class I SAM-dependent methyltransferase [Candidatus Aminicenantes bacterium]|jgi:predicted O-methyltransferase YrrM